MTEIMVKNTQENQQFNFSLYENSKVTIKKIKTPEEMKFLK